MKSVIRSIKNEINNYDEGERLVRELTSNESTPPSTQMLIKLKTMLTNTYQFPTVVRMLFKRLRDYNNIRHVEKSLIVIEYLLKNGDRKFVRYCQMEVKSIAKLQRYRYMLQERDYGGLIRKRAKRIYDLLKDENKLNAARAKSQGYAMQFKSNSKKNKKTNNYNSSSNQKHSHSNNSNNKISEPKKKKKKAKKKKVENETTTAKESNEPVFESFIDIPENNAMNSTNNAVSDNLLDGDWWKKEEENAANDDFGWYQPTNFEKDPIKGFGEDGGEFNFAENDFDDDLNENKDDVDTAEQWMTSLTNMDNVLVVDRSKNKIKKRNKTGPTMAELANNSTNYPSQPMNSEFDTAFITQSFNPNQDQNENDNFDPFGLGPPKNTQPTQPTQPNNNFMSNMGNVTMNNNMNMNMNNMTNMNTMNSNMNNMTMNMGGLNMNTNPNTNFGYQPKQPMNAFGYRNDPFAGLDGVNKNKNPYQFSAGPVPATIPRKQEKDPFAQFSIK